MNEKEIRQKLKNDFIHYADKCLKIRTKSGSIEPLALNKAQKYIHERLEKQKRDYGFVRALILKGRQQGCSTYVGARFYHLTTHSFGIQTFILAHKLDATGNLYKMAQRFYEHTPELVKPEISTNNTKELNFGKLDSGYKVGTAENKDVGRSATIQLFHGCLGIGTKIIDPKTGGLKNIEEFQVGDKVKTHLGNNQEISFISSQKKDCYKITLRTLSAFPLVSTEEHRFWTKNGWQELKDLKIGDSIGFPIKKINCITETLDLPLAPIRKHGGGKQFICPNNIYLSYEFGLVVGLYLAEGHLKLQNKYPHFPSHVSFAVHRKEVDRTLNWLNKIKEYCSSINVNHRDNCLTSVITVYGNRFASLINNLCGRLRGKHFPFEWENYPEDFTRGMLHGYISGDGHSNGEERRVRVSSICSALSIGCRDIAATLGYGWGAIEYKKPGIRHGRNEKERFTFSLCGDGAYKLAIEIGKISVAPKNQKTISIKNFAANTTEISGGYAWVRINEIEYHGIETVYDFEVPGDHSYCTIHAGTHNSEVAFWNNADEHSKGIMQAIPSGAGEIILESTANGVGNFFHQKWQEAEAGISEYQAIFVPWFWQEEYKTPIRKEFKPTPDEQELIELYQLTPEQLLWRRNKIIEFSVNGTDGEKAFKQEYPNNSTEAFQLTGEDMWLDSSLIMRARKCKVEPYGPLIIGVDPARYGDDRTSIVRRRGRVAYGLESYTKKDTMEVAGIVHRIIAEEKPAKVMVDIGGLGAGVVDRLNELGHRDVVLPVNAGSKPLDSKRYFNKRSEMWGELKGWLLDEPCQIPDVDSLHADLGSLKYKFDSNSLLRIESKEDAKKRGVRSPDEADALCLTFALPSSAYDFTSNKSEISKKLASNLNARISAINQASNYYGSGSR